MSKIALYSKIPILGLEKLPYNPKELRPPTQSEKKLGFFFYASP
jgi:hypothetical protein